MSCAEATEYKKKKAYTSIYLYDRQEYLQLTFLQKQNNLFHEIKIMCFKIKTEQNTILKNFF